MKIFPRKKIIQAHVKTLEKKPALYLDFLNSDGFHKFTYFTTHKELWDNIENFEIDGQYYINETIINGQKRKPYLDLEKIFDDKEAFELKYDEMFHKLRKDIIKVFKSEYQQTLKERDVLILDSSGKVGTKYKLSFHVIVSPKKTLYYTSSKHSESSAYHFYASLVYLDVSYRDYLDESVYNTDFNFRIIGAYKTIGGNRCLVPIDSKGAKIDLDDDAKLNYLLTYIHKDSQQLITPKIEQAIAVNKKGEKKIIKENKPPKTDCTKYLLKCVQKYHPTAFFNNFNHNSCYEDGYYHFGYRNRKEKCPFSGLTHDGNNLRVRETDRGYYMSCFSTKCKGHKSIHIGYADAADEFIESAIQVNRRYLLPKDEAIHDGNDIVKNSIIEWAGDVNFKILAIKSAMDTGKTTMITKTFKEFPHFERVLWITHRQTLTEQIFGKFSPIGFSNYLEEKGSLFDKKRVIVQIDSLFRIRQFIEGGSFEYPVYDLVIIDEIEGNLNHYDSSFLNKGESTARDVFDFAAECITDSSKLIVMDADMGIRTKIFIEHFDKSPIVINNNYKPKVVTEKCKEGKPRKFIVTKDFNFFTKQLLKDIKDGKKICVASMSAKVLEKIASNLKEMGIKYTIHTKMTGDDRRKELRNVEEYWIQFQVVLYSPTIECGVDFNRNHFDKIYGVCRSGQLTCSQRSFIQMIGRIRIIKDDEILVHYHGSCDLTARIYTYENILAYFRYYETLNGKKFMKVIKYKKTKVDGKIIKERLPNSELDLFDEISIHNEVESLNKNPSCFMTVLNKLILRTGNILTFRDDEEKEEEEMKDKQKPEAEVLSEINEASYSIDDLLDRQKRSCLDETEKLVLKKHFFKVKFGLKNSTDKELFRKFYETFQPKEFVLGNFEKLFGYKTDNPNNEKLDIKDDALNESRKRIIFDLLSMLTNISVKDITENELMDISIGKDSFWRRMDRIRDKSIYFKNVNESRTLFYGAPRKSRAKVTTKKKTKKQMAKEKEKDLMNRFKIIKPLLLRYGILLFRDERVQKEKVDVNGYVLTIDEEIKNIAELKHRVTTEICDDLEDYTPLFAKKKKIEPELIED